MSQCCDPKLAVQSLGLSTDKAVIKLRRGFRYDFTGNNYMFKETIPMSEVEVRQ